MPELPSTDDATRVRDLLAASGYDEAGLRAALGSTAPPQPQHRRLGRFLERTREPTPFNTLARWFLAGIDVDETRVATTLPGWFLDFCRTHGLLAHEGGTWRPRLLLLPQGRFWIAADRFPWDGKPLRGDYVLPPSPSADALLRWTLPVEAGTTLDLGTGCGMHAFHAAARSGRVVATDLTARAVEFTRFGARLNGIENIEVVAGDAYAPVAGRRFDHIVSNPPFVVTPSGDAVYRENPLLLDGFVRALARGAAAHLAAGGFFQMVCEWAEVEGEPWPDRLAAWFDGCGCDAWVLHGASDAADEYALARLRELPPSTPRDDVAAYDRWMDHYRQHRLRAVHGGLVTLRRRDGDNWVRIDDVPESDGAACGAALLRRFRALDRLAAHRADGTLGEARLRRAAELVLQARHRATGQGWSMESLEARVEDAFRPRTSLDPAGADFLGGFDGRRTVDEVVTTLATQLRMPAADIRDESLRQVETLVEHGFLEPT